MEKAEKALKAGKIGVMPTDTLYGLVASANDSKAVERIYSMKKRDSAKPLIVLLSNKKELARFGVKPSDSERTFLEKVWPGAVSVIFPVADSGLEYLHRGKGSIAFRVPEAKALREFIERVGPLVAPSANPEGEKPAETPEEARAYFGRAAAFYIDGGKISGEPSTIVEFVSGKPKIVRQGAEEVDI